MAWVHDRIMDRNESMEISDQLCQMIRSSHVVELRATTDPADTSRVVEPHAVYIGSNNRGFVDFFQRSGYSRSGDLPGWRRFALSDVAVVHSTPERFEPRADYRPDNRRWYHAFVCAVEPDLLIEPAETNDEATHG
jgi:hypothetical protein